MLLEYTVREIRNTPPAAVDVADGDMFLIWRAPTAGSTWVGHAGEIAKVASVIGPTWDFIAPVEGTRVVVQEYHSKAWTRKLRQAATVPPWLWVEDDSSGRVLVENPPMPGLDIYCSDLDFTVAYSAPTVLQIGNLPAALTNINKSQILRVWQWVEGLTLPTIWRTDENNIEWDNTTKRITIPSAQFAASDTFLVEIKAQPKNLPAIQNALSMMAQSGTEAYFSPIDLTATYASATTLSIIWTTLPLEPVTAQFLAVIEYTATGVAKAYTPELYPFSYNPATTLLTVTGATFANTSTYRVMVLAQAKAMGIADIAIPTLSQLIGLRAHSGNPAPVSADDDMVPALATLLGQLRVYLDSALNRVNDEVRSEDIPPPEIVVGGSVTKVSAVGTPQQLTGTSYSLKRGVWVRISPLMAGAAPGPWAGFHYTSTANSIWHVGTGAWAAGRLIARDHGELFIPLDDPSKLYFDGPGGGEIIVWQAV